MHRPIIAVKSNKKTKDKLVHSLRDTEDDRMDKQQLDVFQTLFYGESSRTNKRRPRSQFAYRLVCLCLCQSLCHVRSCIVLKRQKISTRCILHTTAQCFFQIVLKFGLPLPPNILPQSDPPSVDLIVGDIRWRIVTG